MFVRVIFTAVIGLSAAGRRDVPRSVGFKTSIRAQLRG
jgi:hypothetical protein